MHLHSINGSFGSEGATTVQIHPLIGQLSPAGMCESPLLPDVTREALDGCTGVLLLARVDDCLGAELV
jgi:hypothetical protein